MNQFKPGPELRDAVQRLKAKFFEGKTPPRKLIEGYQGDGDPSSIPVYLVTHALGAKHLGINTKALFGDLNLYARSQIELTELLGHDYIYSAADIFDFEAEALGAELSYPEEISNPSLRKLPLAKDKDFSRLESFDPTGKGRLPGLLAMKAFLARELGGLFIIEATGSAPFSLACHLRGFEKFLMDMMMDPAYAKELLEFCVACCRANLSAQLAAGAGGVHIADAWAAFPMVNLKIYEEFILPATTDLFQSLPKGKKAWTGLYGLCRIKDGWKAHLRNLAATGLSELCVYQEDLENLDLAQLAELADGLGLPLKAGLFGTELTPYNPEKTGKRLEKWISALGCGGRLAIHTSNLPWDTKLSDAADVVQRVKALAALIPS